MEKHTHTHARAHKIHSASGGIVPSRSTKLKRRWLLFSDVINVTGIDLGKHTYFSMYIFYSRQYFCLLWFLFRFRSMSYSFSTVCEAKFKSSSFSLSLKIKQKTKHETISYKMSMLFDSAKVHIFCG